MKVSASIAVLLVANSAFSQMLGNFLVDKVQSMTSWVADKLEIEIDNKIGQYMIEQSWLGFEYFSDGVRSKGERDIVKSRPYVEENNRIESVANAKAVDFERFTGSFVLQSIMPDFSPYYYLCPERCPDCILSTSEILCRICCPDMFHTPLHTQIWSWRAPTPTQPGSWPGCRSNSPH